ncbi:MAG TPA: FixH family protein, partial [Nitrospirota bacterium]|nr:FixH family protein [Nitrospirota bacterium]
MKRFAVFTMALFLAAGAAYAKDYEVQKKAGEYDVKVAIDRNPPVVGDNNVAIEIKGAGGHHVKDAQVKVEYSMPAMPGMPPMNYKTDAVLKGDVYKAMLGLSMAGSWNITVKITREGKTSNMKFTVDA